MANIRDVARRAGVSITTVSRVMNQDASYRTTEETRQKVWRAASELSYMLPNNPSRIRTTPAQADDGTRIGCIFNATPDRFTDPFYASALEGIQGHFHAHGHSLCRVFDAKRMDQSDMQQTVLSAKLDALIVCNLLEAGFQEKLSQRVPILVQIADSYQWGNLDLVTYDHHQAVLLALTHLFERGHKRIAYVGSPLCQESPMADQDPRFAAFHDIMRRQGLPVEPEWALDCQWSRGLCRDQVARLLERPGRPTAILAGSDHMAAVILNTLYEQNVRVPNQMAVASICDMAFARYTTPPLTSVYVPSELMGRHAAEIVTRRLAGDSSPKKHILFPVRLSVRETT